MALPQIRRALVLAMAVALTCVAIGPRSANGLTYAQDKAALLALRNSCTSTTGAFNTWNELTDPCGLANVPNLFAWAGLFCWATTDLTGASTSRVVSLNMTATGLNCGAAGLPAAIYNLSSAVVLQFRENPSLSGPLPALAVGQARPPWLMPCLFGPLGICGLTVRNTNVCGAIPATLTGYTFPAALAACPTNVTIASGPSPSTTVVSPFCNVAAFFGWVVAGC